MGGNDAISRALTGRDAARLPVAGLGPPEPALWSSSC